MADTESSNTSPTSLKVNIEGRQLLRTKGLIFPVNPFLINYGMGIKINLLDIHVECNACMDERGSRKAHYICDTEGTYVCDVCLGFCYTKGHNWRELHVPIQKQATYRS